MAPRDLLDRQQAPDGRLGGERAAGLGLERSLRGAD